ncbi:hypothetical protein CDL12_00342 [Handroanthus impetiginosus]|uniref:Uncharacterized protein n=1 Tax=Handroanthus impetiginosus TaxID=429701 RepID=A0A2G9IAX2_9LAMI|nr:hypothetical protein CDL12_00342 [Handroanthus impetiginosus]
MNYKKRSILFITFIIYIVLVSKVHVDATRILSNDFSESNHLVMFSIMPQNAKETMSYWFQQLASGPSHRGAGH